MNTQTEKTQTESTEQTLGVMALPVHNMIIDRLTPVAQIVAELQKGGTGFDADQVAELISDMTLSKAEIATMVRKLINDMPPQEIEIILRDHSGAKSKIKGAHPNAPDALAALQQPRISDCNVVIWGEASSGKTTMAEQIAKGMELDFYYSGAALTKFDLLGYQLPNGTVVTTPFVEAWINGGVFLLDDADRSNPQAISMLNMALANGKCDFSNTGQGMIERHKNCYIIFTANTPMTGANAQYSTAAKIDGATRGRFTFVQCDIDQRHELKITPNTEWTRRVQNLRKVTKQLGGNIQNTVTPCMRASFLGAALLKAGLCQHKVEEMTIFKGAGKDMKTQIYALAGVASKVKGAELINTKERES